MHPLRVTEWLKILEKEYLREFISEGGSSVKFAMGADEMLLSHVHEGLATLARAGNFLFASANAKSTRLHMVDRLFNAVAHQVNWQDLSRRFLARAFTGNRYTVPSSLQDLTLDQVARLNGREPLFLRKEVNRWLEESIFRDFAMTQEFRIAMMQLCRAQLEGKGSEGATSLIVEWLKGELVQIAALKGFLIFQRVARHNARQLLFSLARWTRLCGMSGLVLVLDISKYLVKPRRGQSEPEELHYSMPAVLDAYEVLREFIDATDEVQGLMVVVLAPESFETDENRGIEAYDALRMRIAEEVRDKNRANPFSPLVRLAERTKATGLARVSDE